MPRRVLCCRPKVAWGIVMVNGLALAVAGLLMAYLGFPIIIDNQLAKNLNLWDPESEGRKNFVSLSEWY